MKHGERDVERQISIQGILLSAFWNYFCQREGSLNIKYVLPQISKTLNSLRLQIQCFPVNRNTLCTVPWVPTNIYSG